MSKYKKLLPALIDEQNNIIGIYKTIDKLKKHRTKYLEKGIKTKVVVLFAKNYRGTL